MKTVICDICHVIGAESYVYVREKTRYPDYEKKIPDYEVDLCATCVVRLYKQLIRCLYLKHAFGVVSEHVDSIKTLTQCPATDVSTSPPPMK